MNRRSFMGLFAAAVPVAMKAAPTVLDRYTEAGKILDAMGDPSMQAHCLTQQGTVVMDGISIRYIRDWDDQQSKMVSHIEANSEAPFLGPKYISPFHYMDYSSVRVVV